MPYLFLLTVGPVQDFIKSARRTRDLWFGSWQLSELSKAAARTIVDSAGLPSLIFPSPPSRSDLDPDSEFNVSNRIVALLEQEPADLPARVRTAVADRLNEIASQAFKHVKGPFDRSKADDQVADLLEFYWVALPVTEYKASRARLEALMAARKGTRDFAPSTWGAPIPKSSLDGQRESVIPKQAYEGTLRSLRLDYGLRRGEQLCGIGLLKRHGNHGRDDKFFSTSHVAALPLLERLTEGHLPALQEYIETLRALGLTAAELGKVPHPHPIFGAYDGHLLYEERLADLLEEPELSDARAALRDFFKATKLPRPKPYYALLHADGDNMGRAIDAQGTPDDHRQLSAALADFAAAVPGIVRAAGGSLVYAGGDDVLVFLPLHTVIPCARCLAQRFSRAMAEFTIINQQGERITPSLSVGVAVSHHLDPLSGALELARAAEHAAKHVPGKNALAVTVSKRSGSDRTVSGAWRAATPLYERLELFTRLHRQDALPDGAAYELWNMANLLSVPTTDKDYAKLQELTRVDAMRILGRKRSGHGARALADDSATLDPLTALIWDPDLAVRNLADEMVIARLFAEAADLADLPAGVSWKEVCDDSLDH